jgi:hypothetical protein
MEKCVSNGIMCLYVYVILMKILLKDSMYLLYF